MITIPPASIALGKLVAAKKLNHLIYRQRLIFRTLIFQLREYISLDSWDKDFQLALF